MTATGRDTPAAVGSGELDAAGLAERLQSAIDGLGKHGVLGIAPAMREAVEFIRAAALTVDHPEVVGARRIPNLDTRISPETQRALDDIDAALLNGARLAKGVPLPSDSPALEAGVAVPLDDLLFAYRGLLVLRAMSKNEGLTAAVIATDEIIARLGEIAPQLPGLSSLRAAISPTRETGK